MSSISNIAAEAEQNIFSVSQISALIQNTLTSEFSNIRIKGEISGLKMHTSGHVYFNLKDESSVINSVCWRGTAQKLPFKLEEGLEVVVYGNVNTYPARSNYQIVCNDIKIAGLGALMAQLEERKKKLAAEGLFDPSRKKQLPYMPQTIGVITSPTGAVIKDILHRISERFGVHVLLYPVAVQGEGAAEQVAEGIEFFNSPKLKLPRPDVLIVARGGGSIEDLWAFNEEIVVRAAANSNIPLISAVGHETDTTLIDFASSKRAPTPTAAAEMAVPVKEDLMAGVLDRKSRAYTAISRHIRNLDDLVKARKQALISPKQMLANIAQRLDDITERMNNTIQFKIKDTASQVKLLKSQLSPLLTNFIKHKERDLVTHKKLLESYDYRNVMKRGYSLVKKGKHVIPSASELNSGDSINIQFFDGEKIAVIDGNNDSPKQSAPKKISKPKLENKNSTNQGDLF